MANIGISRRIDDLGRIVIPKEIRRSLAIKEGDALSISIEDDRIILSPASDKAIDRIKLAGAKIMTALSDLNEYEAVVNFEAYLDALIMEIDE